MKSCLLAAALLLPASLTAAEPVALFKGAEIKVRVNGTLVNHGHHCTATSGKIALQAEGAEVEFRKVVLTRLAGS